MREWGGTISYGGTTVTSGESPHSFLVYEGESPEFAVSAQDGYIIESVTIDNKPKNAPYHIDNVADNHSITAKFKAVDAGKVVITASVNQSAVGGTITIDYGGASTVVTSSNSLEVTKDSDIKFTITPYQGYEIADIKVDGTSNSATASHTFTSVQETHTIEASFKANITASGYKRVEEKGGLTGLADGYRYSLSIIPSNTTINIIEVNVKRRFDLGEINNNLQYDSQNKWSFFAFRRWPYDAATLTVYYQVNNHQNSFTINVIINSDDIIEDIYVHA